MVAVLVNKNGVRFFVPLNGRDGPNGLCEGPARVSIGGRGVAERARENAAAILAAFPIVALLGYVEGDLNQCLQKLETLVGLAEEQLRWWKTRGSEMDPEWVQSAVRDWTAEADGGRRAIERLRQALPATGGERV